MALLTEPEITAIWQMIYKRGQGKEEIKTTGLPSRSERTAIFQAVEDVLVAQIADFTQFVFTADRTPQDVKDTQAALDAGRIPADLIPVVEGYIADNTNILTRIDATARDTWITNNKAAFSGVGTVEPALTVYIRGIMDSHIRRVM